MEDFTFTFDSVPAEYEPVNYVVNGVTLSVYYEVNKWDPNQYQIGRIYILKELKPNAVVPTAMGAAGQKGLITSQSIQISYVNIKDTIKGWGKCVIPTIKLGQTATLTVENLVTESDVNLRFDSCTLTIGNKSYTVVPTRFVDNRIADATCSQSGGKRKNRKTRKTRKTRKNRK